MRRIALLMAILFPALQGCGTATIEDAVPAGAVQTSAQEPSSVAFASPGQYPNLNIVPTPATEHLTPEEVAAKSEELRQRRDTLSAGGGGVADETATLRRLGNSHADEALKAIEGR